MPQNDVLLVLQQRPDARVCGGKERILFEILIDIGQHQPLAPLAVGQMELALGIEEDIFPLQNIEFFTGEDVAERADLCHALVDAGTLDIEEDVLHERGTSFSVPPM